VCKALGGGQCRKNKDLAHGRSSDGSACVSGQPSSRGFLHAVKFVPMSKSG